VVELLLSRGASCTLQTTAGETPLQLAETNGDYVTVGILQRHLTGAGLEQRPNKPLPLIAVPPAVVAPTTGVPVVTAPPSVASSHDDDLPPLEPDDSPITIAPPSAASPRSTLPELDLSWRPTDTYGELKRKLELANSMIARLKSTLK